MWPQQTASQEPTREAPTPGAVPSDLVGPFEVTLPNTPAAPAAARAAVSAWLAGHVTDTMLADAQLLVAELVANSVRHSGAPAAAIVRVRAHIDAGGVRLEVEDRGTTGSIARRPPDLEHGGGFGLNVVEMLSARWGVNRGVGTRVWAELAFPAGG
jgi:serine/threonine-protein kinase RsbW